MNILWLGAVFNWNIVQQYAAVAQSSGKWTNGLLNALQDNGHSIFVVGHRPEQAWPRGKFWPGNKIEMTPLFHSDIVHYINLWPLKNQFLKINYWQKIKEVTKTFKPDIILTYNPYSFHNYAAEKAHKKFNIPWIPVILDLDAPDKEWSTFKQQLHNSSGFVFLSDWAYRNQPLKKPSLHLDSGAPAWFGDDTINYKKRKKILLYAGKYGLYGGVTLLADAIKQIKSATVEIILCGKGSHPSIDDLVKNDVRVRRLGYVTDEDLHTLCLKADIFLNVRPPEIADNLMTFPSKLIDYLSYGKPVISSWTEGLSSEYRRFVQVPSAHTAQEFAKTIDNVLGWSDVQIAANKNELRPWFIATHTWDVQAHRLVNWIQNKVF